MTGFSLKENAHTWRKDMMNIALHQNDVVTFLMKPN